MASKELVIECTVEVLNGTLHFIILYLTNPPEVSPLALAIYIPFILFLYLYEPIYLTTRVLSSLSITLVGNLSMAQIMSSRRACEDYHIGGKYCLVGQLYEWFHLFLFSFIIVDRSERRR
jgi:hypothetical protein